MKRILILSCLMVAAVRFAASQPVPPVPPARPAPPAAVAQPAPPAAVAQPAQPAAVAQPAPPALLPAPPPPSISVEAEDDDMDFGPMTVELPMLIAQAAPQPPVVPVPPVPPSVWGKGSYLGIGVREVVAERAKELKLPEERGVEVTTVAGDSPADKAGLKEGDVVLEYNGQRVEGVEQFIRMVRETPAGRHAKLLISRGGANQTLTATIAEHNPFQMGPQFHRDMDKMGEEMGRQFGPDSKFQRDMQKMQRDLGRMRFEFEPNDLPQGEMVWKTRLLGIEAESVNSQLAEFFGVKQGVLVRSVSKDSAAEKAGLKAGDIITKVGETEVGRPGEVSRQLREAPAGKPVALSVVRNHRPVSVNVTVESKPLDTGEKPRRIRDKERRITQPPAAKLVSSPGADF